MRRTLKALVALTAVAALVTLNASPGAAQTGTVTGGTISVNLVPPLTQPLVSTGGSCDNTLDFAFTTSLTSGHSGLSILGHFTYAGSNFLLELNYSSIHVNSTHTGGSNPTATYSLTSGSSTGTGFTVTDVNVYPSTGVDSCTKSGTAAKCGNIDVNFPVMNGTFTGSVTGTSHTLDGDLALTSNIVASIAAAGCTPPFSALNGKTATIAGLTASVDP